MEAKAVKEINILLARIGDWGIQLCKRGKVPTEEEIKKTTTNVDKVIMEQHKNISRWSYGNRMVTSQNQLPNPL